MQNSKLLAELEARERADAERWQKAGIGSAPKTYAYDPTRQSAKKRTPLINVKGVISPSVEAKFIVINRIKGFRQVQAGGAELGPNFLALLLRLVGSENHVDLSAVSMEATPAFRQRSLFEMAAEAVEEDVSEDPPGDAEQRDASVVTSESPVTFPLVELDDRHVLKIIRGLPWAPHLR
nr:unnamed protein product [Spirometra erinaceieuropaei]